MATPEQDRIINELLTNFREIIEDRSVRIPADWNGFELRRWMLEVFKEEFTYDTLNKNTVRMFNQERIRHNV